MDLALFLFQVSLGRCAGEALRETVMWNAGQRARKSSSAVLWGDVTQDRDPASVSPAPRQTGSVLTRSPGLTEMATTTPGIGERRMLLVSSAAFSSINLFNSAASLVRIRTLYYKGGEKKSEVTWWTFPPPMQRLFTIRFQLLSHTTSEVTRFSTTAHGSETRSFASALCCGSAVYEISRKRNESSNSLVTNSNDDLNTINHRAFPSSLDHIGLSSH